MSGNMSRRGCLVAIGCAAGAMAIPVLPVRRARRTIADIIDAHRAGGGRGVAPGLHAALTAKGPVWHDGWTIEAIPSGHQVWDLAGRPRLLMGDTLGAVAAAASPGYPDARLVYVD
jgi:hypothetical protein